MQSDIILDVKDLTVGYDSENGYTTIIKDFNLRVRKGLIHTSGRYECPESSEENKISVL